MPFEEDLTTSGTTSSNTGIVFKSRPRDSEEMSGNAVAEDFAQEEKSAESSAAEEKETVDETL